MFYAGIKELNRSLKTKGNTLTAHTDTQYKHIADTQKNKTSKAVSDKLWKAIL